MFRVQSLRWRLTAFYLAMLSVLLILLGAAQYFAIREVLLRSNAEVLANDYSTLLTAFKKSQQARTGTTPTTPIQRLLLTSQFATYLSSQRIGAVIIGPAGVPRASASATLTPDQQPPPLSTDQYLAALRGHPRPYYLAPQGDPTTTYLTVLIPIRLSKGASPIGLAQLSTPTDGIEQNLRQDRWLVLVGSVAVLLLALILTPLIVARALRPLHQVARTAAALAAGDYRQRVPGTHGDDEIGRVAQAFNEMAGGIEQAFEVRRQSEERMRQFVADASHELRTPLTALAGYIDVLGRRDSVDPEILQSSLAAMQRESGRMTRLVTDLLTLTRIESGRGPALRPLPLDAWLAAALDELGLQDQGVTATRRFEPGIMVNIDPDALKQVVNNLAQNAMKYAPGAEQHWSCFAEGTRTAFRVEDTGPGISGQDLPHIFERFYRGEKARDRAAGGSGLGLAIAKSIVEAHGGTIEAKSPPGGGATFTVWLPLVRALSPAKT
jgi:two-component system OmpR family sensor kinase